MEFNFCKQMLRFGCIRAWLHVEIMSLKGGAFLMWILRMLRLELPGRRPGGRKKKEEINGCVETWQEVRTRFDGASWFAVATPVDSSRKWGESVEAWKPFMYHRFLLIFLLPDAVLNTSQTPVSQFLTEYYQQTIQSRVFPFREEKARQKAVIAALWI